MNDLISVKNIYRTYKLEKSYIPVLRGLDIDIYRNEWLCLLGSSGSGKTTLLNLIGCLEYPDKGIITYNGVNVCNVSRKARSLLRIKNIGFIFQAYHLLPELNVLENVKLPSMLNGCFGKKATEKAEDLLVKVGLKERLKHRPSELSGGEQQRVAIARALINDPKLVLADEPTGNLDSKTGEGILEIFKELHNSRARTIIMVTHNPEVARLSDRTAVIKDGKIEKN